MTKGQQALSNIARYSATHKGILYEDVKTVAKELKALEIIKEKEPDISFLYRAKDLNHYNSCVWKEQELTQEKYDLLKEILIKE